MARAIHDRCMGECFLGFVRDNARRRKSGLLRLIPPAPGLRGGRCAAAAGLLFFRIADLDGVVLPVHRFRAPLHKVVATHFEGVFPRAAMGITKADGDRPISAAEPLVLKPEPVDHQRGHRGYPRCRPSIRARHRCRLSVGQRAGYPPG